MEGFFIAQGDCIITAIPVDLLLIPVVFSSAFFRKLFLHNDSYTINYYVPINYMLWTLGTVHIDLGKPPLMHKGKYLAIHNSFIQWIISQTCLLLVVCQWCLVSLLIKLYWLAEKTVHYHCVHKWRIFANPFTYTHWLDV